MSVSSNVYRDPLSTYLRCQEDPEAIEARESVARARAAQRKERAAALELLFKVDGKAFAHMFAQFYLDDPEIIRELTLPVSARGTVQAYRNAHAD
jgi:hypothetical protein